MCEVGLFLACLDLVVQVLKSVKRRMDANKRLKELVSEAIALMLDMENMMILHFDATNTTTEFTKVLETNLHDFELIKAELAHLLNKLANKTRLKRIIKARACVEKLEPIVYRLSTVKRHIELCAMTAEPQGPEDRWYDGSATSSSRRSQCSRSSSSSSSRNLQVGSLEKVRVELSTVKPQLVSHAIPPHPLRWLAVRRSKSVPYNNPRWNAL